MVNFLVFIGYLIAIAIVLLVIRIIVRKTTYSDLRISVQVVAAVILTVLVVNAVSYGVSSKLSNTSVDTPVSLDEVTTVLNFEPDRAYPLSFGALDYYSKIVDYDDSTGYFSIYFDNARPLKSVAVEYKIDGESTILILQMSDIIFMQEDSVNASIKLVLEDVDYTSVVELDPSYDGAYATESYSACSAVVRHLVLQCGQYVTSKDLVIGPSATPIELKQVVDTYLDHVEVTLRPSQYRLLFD